jgi:hypothetical protein
MTHHDVTRHQAQLLLTHEATLAARYGRRFEQAVGNGDVVAVRRWNREYRLSAFRCRMLGTLLRTSATTTTRPTNARFRTRPGLTQAAQITHTIMRTDCAKNCVVEQVKSAMEGDRLRPVGPRCSAGARGRGVLRPRDEEIAGSSSPGERSRTTPMAA